MQKHDGRLDARRARAEARQRRATRGPEGATIGETPDAQAAAIGETTTSDAEMDTARPRRRLPTTSGT